MLTCAVIAGLCNKRRQVLCHIQTRECGIVVIIDGIECKISNVNFSIKSQYEEQALSYNVRCEIFKTP